MPSSCKDIRAALATCLQNSDCVLVSRHTPADCLRPPHVTDLPTRCQQLKKGYGDCKRGMIDMRKRFRGNQPMAVSKEIEGGGGGGGGGGGEQLYGGRRAVGEMGMGGVEKADGELVEGKDGEWRRRED